MRVEYLPSGSPSCPFVRLFDFDASGAEMLRRMFDALAEGAIRSLILTAEAGVSGIDGCWLVLKVSTRDRGVIRIGHSYNFECLLSCDGWKTLAALTEPFCLSAERGTYQWLYQTGKAALLLSPDGSW